MARKNIYIMSMAASGKSTFAKRNPSFRGNTIVDFAQELPKRHWSVKWLLYLSRVAPFLRKMVREDDSIVALRSQNYMPRVFSFLSSTDTPHVVLGILPPENLEEYPEFGDVRFGMVLINEEDHRRNCESRRREMKNPIPFLHHWTTDFQKIQAVRLVVLDYAHRHNIPVFESFSHAIGVLTGDSD